MKFINLVIMILIMTFATSCVKQTIVAKPGHKVYLTENLDGCKYIGYKKTHYFVWGLFQGSDGPETIYKDGDNVRVETEVTFVDGLVSFISFFGFYSIRTSNIYKCNVK